MDTKDIRVGNRLVKVKIQSLEIRHLSLANNLHGQKLTLCADDDNPKFKKIDECWVKRGNVFVNKGLWLQFEPGSTTKLLASCTVSRLLLFNKMQSLSELEGAELSGVLKSNGYLALLLEDYAEEHIYK